MGISSWLMASYSIERKYLLSVANSSLYDLNDDLKLLVKLRAAGNDKEVLKSSENIVLKRILFVATIKPKLSELQGTPMRALCKALELNDKGALFIYADKKLVELVTGYMESIVDLAKAEMRSRLGTVDGEDCAF